MSKIRDYYKVLLISQPGKGKTYSFRNMNPNTTGFVNIENKPLPFKNQFKHHSRITNMTDAKKVIMEYAQNKEINCIVIDSLSAYLDLLGSESRRTRKGYEVWNYYNDEISKFLQYIKDVDKEIFLTIHSEWLADEGGTRELRAKTQGKSWEGLIEKEFTLVLFVNRKINTETKKVEAWFDLSLDNSSAKCPPDLFGEDVFRINNDSNLVFQKIIEYTKNDYLANSEIAHKEAAPKKFENESKK